MASEEDGEIHALKKISDGDAFAPLTPQARRALSEAEERRRALLEAPSDEIGGRGGLEPTRYGDWEKKGLASDF